MKSLEEKQAEHQANAIRYDVLFRAQKVQCPECDAPIGFACVDDRQRVLADEAHERRIADAAARA